MDLEVERLFEVIELGLFRAQHPHQVVQESRLLFGLGLGNVPYTGPYTFPYMGPYTGPYKGPYTGPYRHPQ